MRASTILASVAAAGLSALPACYPCNDLYCIGDIPITLEVPGGLGAFEGATTRVCREGDCIDSDIVMNAAMADCESVPHEEFSVSCHVTAEGVVKFQIDLRDWDAADEEEYTFSVRGADGAELASIAGTVTYRTSEPNGEGCGYCYSGTFHPE